MLFIGGIDGMACSHSRRRGHGMCRLVWEHVEENTSCICDLKVDSLDPLFR